VIADEMASGGDFADESGALAGEGAYEEEGRADVVLGKDFEQAGGGGGVGAVVVG
jgi:hypothetical protein